MRKLQGADPKPPLILMAPVSIKKVQRGGTKRLSTVGSYTSGFLQQQIARLQLPTVPKQVDQEIPAIWAPATSLRLLGMAIRLRQSSTEKREEARKVKIKTERVSRAHQQRGHGTETAKRLQGTRGSSSRMGCSRRRRTPSPRCTSSRCLLCTFSAQTCNFASSARSQRRFCSSAGGSHESGGF